MTTTKPAILSPADTRKLLRIPQEAHRWQLAPHTHALHDGTITKTPLLCHIVDEQALPLTPPELVTSALTPKLALRILIGAIKDPYTGLPARPTTITTSDEELLAWLKPSAQALDIELILGPTPEAEDLIKGVGLTPDGALDYTQSPDYSRARFERALLASERFLSSRNALIYFPTFFDIFCIRRQDVPEAPLYALTSIGDNEDAVVLVTSPSLELISTYQRIMLGHDEHDPPVDEVTALFFEELVPGSPLYTLSRPGVVALGWSQPTTPMFSDHGELLPDAQALDTLTLAMLAISATFSALSQENPYNIRSDLDRPHALTITLDELPDKPTLQITVPVEQLPSPGLTDDFDPTLTFDQIDDLDAWSTELITRFERTYYYRGLEREIYYPLPTWCMAKIVASAMAHQRASLQTLTLDDIKHGIVTLVNDPGYGLELDSENTVDLDYLLAFINERLKIPNDALIEAFNDVIDTTEAYSDHAMRLWIDDLIANHDRHQAALAKLRRLRAAQSADHDPYGELLRDSSPKRAPAKKKAKNKQQRASRKKNRKK